MRKSFFVNNENAAYTVMFLLLSIAAFATRLYSLETIPPGFSPDEVSMGYGALWIWERQDWRVIYNDYGGSRSVLYFLFLAPLMALIGPGVETLRLVGGVSGALAIIVTGLLARELFYGHARGRAIALFTMTLYITSIWAFTTSRIGYPASQVPLCAVLCMWLLYMCRRKNSRPLAFLSGAAASVGLYSYLGYFAFLPVPFLVGAAWLVSDYRKHLPLALAFAAGFLFVALPFLYSLMNDAFPHFNRINETKDTVLLKETSGPFSFIMALGEKLYIQMRGFYVRGNYLSCLGFYQYRGMLELLLRVTTIAFFVSPAVYFVLRRFRRGRKTKKASYQPYVLLITWFLLGMVTILFGMERPHFLRVIAATPAVMIAGGIGLYHLLFWTRLLARRVTGHYLPVLTFWLLAGILAWHVTYALAANFTVWPASKWSRTGCHLPDHSASILVQELAAEKPVYILGSSIEYPRARGGWNGVFSAVKGETMRMFNLDGIITRKQMFRSNYRFGALNYYQFFFDKCREEDCAIVRFTTSKRYFDKTDPELSDKVDAAADKAGFSTVKSGRFVIYDKKRIE